MNDNKILLWDIEELINNNKTIVLGISKDSIESHLKFKKKYKLKFDLLSDEKKEVIKKYGVWGKKSFLGKEFMGIIRTTFLIKSKGKIHKIWSNVRVKDHAKEVLEFLTLSLENNGYFVINNHPIDLKLISNAFKISGSVFSFSKAMSPMSVRGIICFIQMTQHFFHSSFWLINWRKP